MFDAKDETPPRQYASNPTTNNLPSYLAISNEGEMILACRSWLVERRILADRGKALYNPDSKWPTVKLGSHLARLQGHAKLQEAYSRISAEVTMELHAEIGNVLVVLLALECPDAGSDTGFSHDPVLAVYFDSDSIETELFSWPESARALIEEYSLAVILVQCDFTDFADSPQNRPRAQELSSGISIGNIKSNSTGTLGLLFAHNDRVLALGGQHVLGSVGDRIVQPGPVDFNDWGKKAKRKLWRHQDILGEDGTPPEYRASLENELPSIADEVSLFERMFADPSLREIGTVVVSSCHLKEWDGNKTLCEYALAEIDEGCPVARNNGNLGLIRNDNYQWDPPSEGALSTYKYHWYLIKHIGEIEVGQAVRKFGRTTGIAFGFVVARANIALTNQPLRKEFVCLPEGLVKNDTFGDKGDSGSAVIASDGSVVGILYGGMSSAELRLLQCHDKGGSLALRKMVDNTTEDGMFNGGQWEMASNLSIVTPLSMILPDAGIPIEEAKFV